MQRRVSLLVLTVLVVAACGGADDAQPQQTTGAPVTGVSTTVTGEPGTAPPDTTATTTTVTTGAPAPAGVQDCADVVGATLEQTGSGFRVSATVRSGDTGWEKYADAWIVRTTDGTVLGERVLAHPHETEQPFTRSLSDVAIPADVDEVEIAARDSVNGFCGEVFLLTVPS